MEHGYLRVWLCFHCREKGREGGGGRQGRRKGREDNQRGRREGTDGPRKAAPQVDPSRQNLRRDPKDYTKVTITRQTLEATPKAEPQPAKPKEGP